MENYLYPSINCFLKRDMIPVKENINTHNKLVAKMILQHKTEKYIRKCKIMLVNSNLDFSGESEYLYTGDGNISLLDGTCTHNISALTLDAYERKRDDILKRGIQINMINPFLSQLEITMPSECHFYKDLVLMEDMNLDKDAFTTISKIVKWINPPCIVHVISVSTMPMEDSIELILQNMTYKCTHTSTKITSDVKETIFKVYNKAGGTANAAAPLNYILDGMQNIYI